MLYTVDFVMKHKTALLNLVKELSNVSKTCKIMGIFRDMFYPSLIPNWLMKAEWIRL